MKQKHCKNKTLFELLPSDIYLYILYFVTTKDIFQLQVLSHAFQNKGKTLLRNQSIFWKNKAELTLSEEQLEGVLNYKQLILTHHFFRRIMRREIKYGDPRYISKTPSAYFLKVDMDQYQIGRNEWSRHFSLTAVCSYLITDNAEKLFAASTPLNKMAAAFSQENESIEQINKNIKHSLTSMENLNGSRYMLKDLLFISMLPFIIKARAMRCFDVFIRAYFNLFLGIPYNLSKCDFLSPLAIIQLVFLSKDDYFKKKLIHLVLRIIPSTSPVLYDIINYYESQGNIDLVVKMLVNLPGEKMEQIHLYMRDHNLSHLTSILFPSWHLNDALLTDLSCLLVLGSTYLQNNPKIDINVILSIQHDLNKAFNELTNHMQTEPLTGNKSLSISG